MKKGFILIAFLLISIGIWTWFHLLMEQSDSSSCQIASESYLGPIQYVYLLNHDPSIQNQSEVRWINLSWSFRQRITISNPCHRLIMNVPVKITLDHSFNFNKVNPDGSDIRIIANDGFTQIPYRFGVWSPGTLTAQLSVIIPTLPDTGMTIYLYYGNKIAISGSNTNLLVPLATGDTDTPTVTSTATETLTPTETSTPTGTATGTPTNTQTLTPTGTNTGTPTNTQTLTPTRTNTGTPTNTQTLTPTGTNTGTPTNTQTLTPTGTNTGTPTNTQTLTPTGTNTGTPTNTQTLTPTRTNTGTPTNTQTLTPTRTLTVTPTTTQSTTPSQTSTATKIIDPTKPDVSWVSPVEDGKGFYLPNNTNFVLLIANATDNMAVDRVHFFRWDKLKLQFIDIGTVFNSPYQWNLDINTLYFGWNEIDVEAFDTAGNVSFRKYIFLYRTEFLYLPLISNG
jgi:hypothetical protein